MPVSTCSQSFKDIGDNAYLKVVSKFWLSSIGLGQKNYTRVMKTFIMWMISFNDTKKYETFLNTNFHLSQISCEFELFVVF